MDLRCSLLLIDDIGNFQVECKIGFVQMGRTGSLLEKLELKDFQKTDQTYQSMTLEPHQPAYAVSWSLDGTNPMGRFHRL